MNLVGQGNEMRLLFRSNPFIIIRTALSVSIRNGIGKPLTSVIRDLIKPGQITFIFTSYLAKFVRKDSPYDLTAAFDAQ